MKYLILPIAIFGCAAFGYACASVFGAAGLIIAAPVSLVVGMYAGDLTARMS